MNIQNSDNSQKMHLYDELLSIYLDTHDWGKAYEPAKAMLDISKRLGQSKYVSMYSPLTQSVG